MNREEYLTLINETGYVDSKGEAQRFMDESSYRAQQIVSEINNKYHTQSEIQELMSELTQEKVSETLKIFPPIYTDFGMNLHLGKNVFINSGCCFQDQGGIYIGDNTLIGHQVVFATINHDMDPEKRGSMEFKPIHVGKNVWIGAQVCVLPGVTIGDDSVIGAGSVVTKDIPAGVLAAGNPCRVIREISEADKLRYSKIVKL